MCWSDIVTVVLVLGKLRFLYAGIPCIDPLAEIALSAIENTSNTNVCELFIELLVFCGAYTVALEVFGVWLLPSCCECEELAIPISKFDVFNCVRVVLLLWC